jgi:hypothetical protein
VAKEFRPAAVVGTDFSNTLTATMNFMHFPSDMITTGYHPSLNAAKNIINSIDEKTK